MFADKNTPAYRRALAKANAENDRLIAEENNQYGKLFDKHFLVIGAPIDPRAAAIGAMRELIVLIKIGEIPISY